MFLSKTGVFGQGVQAALACPNWRNFKKTFCVVFLGFKGVEPKCSFKVFFTLTPVCSPRRSRGQKKQGIWPCVWGCVVTAGGGGGKGGQPKRSPQRKRVGQLPVHFSSFPADNMWGAHSLGWWQLQELGWTGVATVLLRHAFHNAAKKEKMRKK